MNLRADDLEDLEMRLLLEGIHEHYSLDFRQYAPGSLRRRLLHRAKEEGVRTLSGLQEKVLHDPACMERLLLGLSVNVTSMFRDPSFYLAFREKVVPLLRTYPFIRVWNAGCSTGEEAYSLAILLSEEGLYNRTRIYATDINEVVLDKAKAGVFPLKDMREYTDNYIRAGGKQAFSQYYVAGYEGACFRPSLAENIVFAQHNLVSDRSFNEFNVIFCRNVMIYFAKPLQERVHQLLYDSLAMFGVLGLGSKESLRCAASARCYEEVDAAEKLYRKAL